MLDCCVLCAELELSENHNKPDQKRLLTDLLVHISSTYSHDTDIVVTPAAEETSELTEPAESRQLECVAEGHVSVGLSSGSRPCSNYHDQRSSLTDVYSTGNKAGRL